MSHALAIKTWRENPCRFAVDVFGFTPDKWQEQALMAFAANDPLKKRIALRACAGPGKTAVLAIIGLNFLTCYGSKTDHPKGACLSISEQNLKDNLWAEFSVWINKSQLMQALFTLTGSRLFAKDHHDERFLSARAFAKAANAEEVARTLSGIHAKNVLYLIDESGDIPPAVLRAAEQGIGPAETFGKIIQAGNPTSQTGMLYAAATTLAHEWYNIKITADPEDPNRTPRVPKEVVQAQIDNYGRDNPWVRSFYLGEFPESAINTLFSIEEIERSMARNLHPSTYEETEKRLGVDCARFGLDTTVIFPRQGLQAFQPVEMRGARSNEIAARVAQAKLNWGAEQIYVDGTGGYGSGVVDSLIQAGYHPEEIQFSGQSPESQYLNMRAYMYFKLKEWVARGGGLPNDGQLKKELTAMTYSFKNGKFQIESKDQIKARLGFSPDKSDGLCLTFAMPDRPSMNHIPKVLRKANVKSDYNPFDRD